MKNKKGISLILIIIAIVVLVSISAVVVVLVSDKNQTNNEIKENTNSNENVTNSEETITPSNPVNTTTSVGSLSAKIVGDNASEYYGKTVTNYTANGVSDWKIFHSDGENIYLISSEYLPIDKIPATKGGAAIVNTNSKYPKAAQLMPAVNDTNYSNGSESISSTNPARKWLKSYFDNNYTSGSNDNMQALAYMMDTDVWNTYKTGKADYAIGGPTLEMLAASYNKIHESKKIEYKITENGYDVKWSTDENFDDDKWHISGISTSESLYVLPSYETSGAKTMWLASPSGAGPHYLMHVHSSGDVGAALCGRAAVGFRPIVCLSSGIQMEQNDDGSVSIK